MGKGTRSVVVALAVGALVMPAFAWGRSGHRIVGEIAATRLTDQARAGVIDLLGDDDLADVANWADEIRSDPAFNFAKPWHFINVPRDATEVDFSRDCPAQGCVLSAIKDELQTLIDDTASHDDKEEALKFLVHFVGDLHQPLHVSYKDDLGGNQVDARFFGSSTNLHSLWDTAMIERRCNGDWESMANDVNSAITAQQAADWMADADLEAWATESLEYTRLVYEFFENEISAGDDVIYEQEEYAEDILIIEERLAMAGVRLAALLNSIYHTDSDPESSQGVTICSFNIQFLGNFTKRDDAALATILEDFDIVIVQELVSPPFAGTFPDGDPFNPDPESAEFFNEMIARGFDFILSEEDTGTGDVINVNGSSTEWWVTFFKPESVEIAADLPSGFLASDRSNHPDYERVPYAFAFRVPDDTLDFVLISVHLEPGAGPSHAQRRKDELAAIAEWVDDNDATEKDFIILGDMNIEDVTELASVTPAGFVSLNASCVPTNTNVNGPKPYDHVMVQPAHTTEVDETFGFVVINLIEEMEPFWPANSSDPYPGDPYNHNLFKQFFSDHHPVIFHLKWSIPDDD